MINKKILLTFQIIFLLLFCSPDNISVEIELIPPCASESKNYINDLDSCDYISLKLVRNKNNQKDILYESTVQYSSGFSGDFSIDFNEGLDNLSIEVDGYNATSKSKIFNGYSPIFSLGKDSSKNKTIIPVLFCGLDAFCQTTDFSTKECSVIENGLQGATVTPLPNGDVLIAGGIIIDGTSKFYSASFYLYNSQKGTFEEIEIDDNIKEFGARAYHTATLYNKGTKENPEWKVLIVGGETYINGKATSVSTAELYDVQTKKVKFLLSTLEEGRTYHTATFMQNGKIIIIGGENKVDGKVETYFNTVEIFDTQEETFKKLFGKDYHTMTYARSRHTATYLPLRYNTVDGEPIAGLDKILLAGGIRKVDSQLYINDEMEIFGCVDVNCTDYRFDIVLKNDNTPLKMVKKRYGHQAVAVMTGVEPIGKWEQEFHNFYVAFLGGYTCIGIDRCAGSTSLDCQCPDNDVYKSITTSIEIIDPTHSGGPQTVNVSNMSFARADFAAVSLNRENDNILIFGGYGNQSATGTVTDVVELMTISKKTAIINPHYHIKRMLYPRADFAFGKLIDGRIFIFGGNNGKNGTKAQSINTAEIFNPSLEN